MSEITSRCWFNGRIVDAALAGPSVASISFHMGTGVFDGLMAYWNGDHYYLHEARAHFDRLGSGAANMGMKLAWSSDALVLAVQELLKGEPPRTYYIRPIVYRQGPELWLTGAEGRPVDCAIFGVPVQRDRREPLSCALSCVERVSSKAMPVKWKVCGLYVNSFLARKEAELAGVNDGLMLDRQGRLAELSAANIFFINRNGGLATPCLNDDVFPGVTRSVVIRLSEALGIQVAERDLYPSDLRDMRGAFVSSTLMELRPIDRIGELLFDTATDTTFLAVSGAFSALTHQ